MKICGATLIKKYLFIVFGVIIAISAVFISNYFQKNLNQYNNPINQNNTQKHDFLLALSWSPTYCLEQDPQGKQPQCNIALPKQYRFIVHGLWPQLEKKLQEKPQKKIDAEKYLNYCKTVNKNLEASIVENYFYFMPSSGLMQHQWEKHASCGNFTQQSYFKTIENLYQKFKIATLFHEVKKTQSYLLNDLIAKITVHIPAILRENIVIVCHKNTLAEIRICLNNDYTYRKCHYTEIKSGRCKTFEEIKIPVK